MKIPVDTLTTTPQRFAFEAEPGWWRSLAGGDPGLPREPAEPLRFALEAHRIGPDLLLEGEFEGVLELECARCTARYRHRLRESYRLVLEPAGERTPADPEGAAALARDGVCLGEELEAGWYRGSELELGPFFLEVVLLALPVKPLCREECQGLCPRCGAELVAGGCGCQPRKSNSPFAVLASLRSGQTETGGKS